MDQAIFTIRGNIAFPGNIIMQRGKGDIEFTRGKLCLEESPVKT